MNTTKIEVESNQSGATSSPPLNAADALIEIARDSLHGHLNTLGRLSEVLIPTSLGTLLRHDVPQYDGPNWDFLRLGAGQCSLWNAFSPNLHSFTAPVSAVDDGDAYTLEFAVPGIDSTDINVLVSSRAVLVQGRKLSRGETKNVVYGKWTSSEELSHEGATAALDKGVLKVSVLKIEANRPHRVEITT